MKQRLDVVLAERTGERVVLAHGTFDLLHPGHVAYLEFAKGQGDKLIVALASDEITKFRKGPNRPIQSFSDRKKLVEALRYVDGCVKTLRPTKDLGKNLIATIEKIRPDVFVSSYAEVAENFSADFERLCVSFVVAPYFAGGTTTKIIERILDGHETTA